MRLGQILRRYRIIEERTIRDLALEVGVSPATWVRFEQGKAIDTGTFMKLANWLTEEGKGDGEETE